MALLWLDPDAAVGKTGFATELTGRREELEMVVIRIPQGWPL
jgi:hypothetical protein